MNCFILAKAGAILDTLKQHLYGFIAVLFFSLSLQVFSLKIFTSAAYVAKNNQYQAFKKRRDVGTVCIWPK